MTVVIRSARATDAAALADVAAITFPLACPPHTTDDAKAQFIMEILSTERFRGYLADADRGLLVAQEAPDGPLIGYTMLIFGEPHDEDVAASVRHRPTVELSKCYLLPGHHGLGVAAQLMTASVDAAAASGAASVWLGVNMENARAIAFYRKAGFEIVGAKHFLVGARLEDDHVMERPL